MNNKNKSKSTIITKIQYQWQGLHKKNKKDNERILKDDIISKPVYKSVIL